MQTFRFLCFFVLVILMTSCSKHSNCDEVLCETVHRYGVPLDPQDWSARGQDGQVVSMRKDGVTVTRTYDRGILHGDSTYTFPYRNIIQKKEIYDHGTLMQEIYHYPNGLPMEQIQIQSPTHQSLTVWYENGAPQCQEELENGSLILGGYYNVDHEVESRVDGASGLKIRRDGIGQMISQDTIQNGEMVLRTTFHPNGMPQAYVPYEHDMIQGQRRTFFSDGEPEAVEEWFQNRQHGTTTVFEQGLKTAEVPYANGKKQGIEHCYRDDQTLAQEITWIQGEKHGPSYNYIGNSVQTEWYFRGRKVANKATFDMLCNQ